MWIWKKTIENRLNQKTQEQAEIDLKTQLEEEIFGASRAPTAEEQWRLQKFLDIARRHGVNEIRLIDANSLIRSMYFSEENEPKRQHLLNLLSCRSSASIDQEIDEFVEDSRFGVEEDNETTLNETISKMNAFREKMKKSL